MSYVTQNLLANEVVEYSASPSVWSLLPKIILGFLLLYFWYIGVIFFILAAISYFTGPELAITNKRVIAKFGFISRNTIEMNLDKVESVQVEQSILGRIFNYGSIIVSGAGNPKAPIPGISHPVVFRSRVFELQEKLQELQKAA